MTNKEIKEGNAIIARFTGYPTKNVPHFHTSWNWLIPSLRKFGLIISNMYKEQNKELFYLWDLVITHYKDFDIEYTFISFTNLLVWYNKQKK